MGFFFGAPLAALANKPQWREQTGPDVPEPSPVITPALCEFARWQYDRAESVCKLEECLDPRRKYRMWPKWTEQLFGRRST